MKTIEDIYPTLNAKIANLTQGCPVTANYTITDKWIKDHCYSRHYRGTTPFNEVVSWCEDQFGNDWAWAHDIIYFKHERDLMLFLMRWGGEHS